MGKHSRDKGKGFEQLVADAYRTRWPEAVVRRSLQAHRAYEPDVVVEHHPLGSRLWTECNHADAPNPVLKLHQAERDVAVRQAALPVDDPRLWPIVVWRKSGSRVVNLTTRLWVLESLRGTIQPMPVWSMLVVTLDFHAWLAALGIDSDRPV